MKEKKEVFIIATGGSLNNLTELEKDHIRSCPTIAVGHYLLYHELIGIVPDHFLMCGCPSDHPTCAIGTNGMFHTVSDIMREMNLKTVCYTTPGNVDYLKGIDWPHDSMIRCGIDKWKSSRSLPPRNESLNAIAIDCSEHHAKHAGEWATTLKEKFFFASSISTSINLACVLYPGYKIKMVGNDGGVSGNYFHSERNIDPSELTVDGKALCRYANQQMRSKKNIHFNNSNYQTQYCLEKCKDSGNELYNCNKYGWFTKHDEANAEVYEQNKEVLTNLGGAFGGRHIDSLESMKKVLPFTFQIPYKSVIE